MKPQFQVLYLQETFFLKYLIFPYSLKTLFEAFYLFQECFNFLKIQATVIAATH